MPPMSKRIRRSLWIQPFLAQRATDLLAPALPFIYAGGKAVVDKSKDMLLERGIEKLGFAGLKRAKALLDKINPRMGESLERRASAGNPETAQ
jgi:hypothetical protein